MITFTNPWLNSGETLICFGDSLTNAANNFVDILKERLTPKRIEVIKSVLGCDGSAVCVCRPVPEGKVRIDQIHLRPQVAENLNRELLGALAVRTFRSCGCLGGALSPTNIGDTGRVHTALRFLYHSLALGSNHPSRVVA